MCIEDPKAGRDLARIARKHLQRAARLSDGCSTPEEKRVVGRMTGPVVLALDEVYPE